MKYIKLFESFDSNVLTNMIKYISNKIGKKNLNHFKNDLKDILLDNYGLKMSDINDNIEYVSTKNALKRRNVEKFENKFGIYFLKFWFSIKDGYLGVTSEGKLLDDEESFDNDDIDYIKNNLGLKKGTLTRIKKGDISKLKNGDEVVLKLRKLTHCKIYKDNGNIFVIGDSLNGSSPSGNDWKKYGNGSWAIFSAGFILNDHSKLHKYVKNNLDLSIVKEEDYNFYNNNLLLNQGYSDLSNKKIIDNSDFTMIININNILSKDGLNLTNFRNIRAKNRLGSNHFLTNDEIKRDNLVKLMDKYLNKFGITDDSINFGTVKYIISNILSEDLSIFNLKNKISSLNDLLDFIKNIKVYKKELYQIIKKSKLDSIENKKNYQIIKRDYNESELLNFLNNFIIPCKETGKKLNDYILSRDFKSIEDIEKLIIKLRLIKDKLKMRSTIINYSLEGISKLIYNKVGVENHLEGLSKDGRNIFESDLSILDDINKFISSLPK